MQCHHRWHQNMDMDALIEYNIIYLLYLLTNWLICNNRLGISSKTCNAIILSFMLCNLLQSYNWRNMTFYNSSSYLRRSYVTFVCSWYTQFLINSLPCIAQIHPYVHTNFLFSIELVFVLHRFHRIFFWRRKQITSLGNWKFYCWLEKYCIGPDVYQSQQIAHKST